MESFKNWRTYIFMLVDAMLVIISYRASYYFRFLTYIPYSDFMNYRRSIIPIVLIYLVCFHFFKFYNNLWAYAGIDEFILLVGGCIAANLLSIAYGIISGHVLPFGIDLLAGIFCILLTGGFRMSFRVYLRTSALFEKVSSKDIRRVMVIGAGAAGILAVKEMRLYREMKYNPVAFIDDNKNKIRTTIAGIKVLGNRNQIGLVAKNKNIDVILIAIPSISNEDKEAITEICKKTGCKVKIIPGIYEIIDDKVSLSQIRDVDAKALLGRESVKLDMKEISAYVEGKKILVTGGGGSIGSELCRQIARFNPKELAVLDIYENNAYDIQNELKYKFPGLKLRAIIASVRDKKRLEDIFEEFRPDVVFHAAAHKHVPLMEDNPTEAIKNNIFGTLNVSECADKYRVKRFVMISTDKAVNPTNVMGATKRACEMIIQAMDKKSKTEFVAVRFGNVLGSNGSVIPLFKKQIANGGPVTVTHKNITRFFMTIPEAAQLVLQAGAFAKGGEIFVLDMGKPVRIYDLACELIKLSGFEPNKDIKIQITGLRPGEKLYEEVLMDEEGLTKTGHDKIFIGKPTFNDIDFLRKKFERLKTAIDDNDKEEIRQTLKEIVPTYNRSVQEEAAITRVN